MTFPLRVNWAMVVADLQRHGHTLRQVANTIDVDHSTLSKTRYSDMRHATGERLISLWMNVTGEPREALPLSDGMECEL